MQKKLFLSGCFAVALAAVLGGSATVMASPDGDCSTIDIPDPSRDNKVTLCHFTGSTSNPFIINEVSASAAESHHGHHGDCVNDGNSTVCF
jgi:hypothetical protein